MAIEFQYFTIFLIIISLTIMLLKSTNKNKTTKKLPPGPWKLPLIGNMHQLALGLPHRVLRDLARHYGPLMHLQLGEVSTFVVSSPETAKQVMKVHDITFASRPVTVASTILFYDSTDIGFSPYGEYWRQLRKICVLELLSQKRVDSFRSVREEEFSGVVRWLGTNAGSVVNLTEIIRSTMFSIISKASFGRRSNQHETFISTAKESLDFVVGFHIADLYPSISILHYISGIKPKLERLHKQLDKILEDIINDHKINKSSTICDHKESYEDLVDVLLKFEGTKTEDSLTTDNIKAVLLDIFSAGGETSTTTTDWAMAEMLKNPSMLKKAQDEVRRIFKNKGYVDEENFHEMKYLKAVIKETLRLHPPGPLLLPRVCKEACEIDGYQIPLETKFIVNAWAIGRDPKYWEDSECFKPERFLDSPVDYRGTNFKYIPFGAGRRICPGISFGLANVELVLTKLLYHFDWNLPNGNKNEELDMTEVFGLTVTRKNNLYVIPTIYHQPCAG